MHPFHMIAMAHITTYIAEQNSVGAVSTLAGSDVHLIEKRILLV